MSEKQEKLNKEKSLDKEEQPKNGNDKEIGDTADEAVKKKRLDLKGKAKDKVKQGVSRKINENKYVRQAKKIAQFIKKAIRILVQGVKWIIATLTSPIGLASILIFAGAISAYTGNQVIGKVSFSSDCDIYEGFDSSENKDCKPQGDGSEKNHWSVFGGGGSASFNSSDIVQYALDVSVEYREGWGGDGGIASKGSQMKPELRAAFEKLYETDPDNGRFPGQLYTKDCGRFVASAIKTTKDPDYPWGPTDEQISYARKSSKYKEVSCEDRQPGDFGFIDRQYDGRTDHTWLYLGNIQGRSGDWIAEASLEQYEPELHQFQGCARTGKQYWFRFVG